MDFRKVALSTVVTDAKHVGGPEVVPGGYSDDETGLILILTATPFYPLSS